VASNITATDTVNGIHLKSRRGRGGVVENIRFDNWAMRNVGQAITISDAGYQMEGEPAEFGAGAVTNRTPSFRNISVSHVTIDGAQGLIEISGIEEMPTTGVHISDVTGTGRRGLTGSYTDDLELHHVQLNVEAGPAFRMTHSTNLLFDDVSTRKPLVATPVIRLEGTPGAVIRNSRALLDTDVFLSTPEGELKGIAMEGNLLGHAKTPTASGPAHWPDGLVRTRESCLVRFDLDAKHPTEVEDEAKVCLDLVANSLKRNPKTSLALIANTGARAADHDASDAAQRVRNSRDYLTKRSGIDPARIHLYVGEPTSEGPEDIDQIEAQMVAGAIVDGNVETILIPAGATLKYSGLTAVE
jgi:hypothetical protein